MLFVPLLWTQSILCGNYIHTSACCVRLRQHPAPVPGGNLIILLRFTSPSSRPTHIYLMELPQKFLDNLSNNRLGEGAWQDLWHNFAKCSQRNHSSAQCCPRKTRRAFLDIWSCSTLRWRNSLPGIHQLRPWSAVALKKITLRHLCHDPTTPILTPHGTMIWDYHYMLSMTQPHPKCTIWGLLSVISKPDYSKSLMRDRKFWTPSSNNLLPSNHVSLSHMNLAYALPLPSSLLQLGDRVK